MGEWTLFSNYGHVLVCLEVAAAAQAPLCRPKNRSSAPAGHLFQLNPSARSKRCGARCRCLMRMSWGAARLLPSPVGNEQAARCSVNGILRWRSE